MAARRKFNGSEAMASRWRRRRMCVLIAELPVPAALRHVSATGAFLETSARPAIGSAVELHHPDAGAIPATVSAVASDGISIGFQCGEMSVAFALAANFSDMTRASA